MVRKIILLVAITNFLKYLAAFDNASSTVNHNSSNCEHSSCLVPTHEWPLKDSATEFRRRKWISQLFSEAKMHFDMHASVNPLCREHFQLYKSHLENQTIWAVRMMDSTEWPSVGIFSGMTHHLGNWAECLRATGPKLIGRYCMVNGVVDVTVDDREFQSISENSDHQCDEELSAWNVIKKYERDPICMDRRKLSWALCVPSTCGSSDVQISLISTLNPIFRKNNLNIRVDVVPENCATREEIRPLNSPGYSYTRKLYLVIIFLVISASIFDSLQNKKTVEEDHSIVKFLLCFSIRRNFESLITCTTNMEYPAIHFMKLIGVVSQSIAHRWMFSFRFGMFQTEELEIELKSGILFFLSMVNYMDVFFLISGLFLYRWCMEPLRKGGVKFLFISLIFRLMKMIPTLAIAILFMGFVLPNTGDGPYWNWSMSKSSEPCRSIGWMNLVALNNFVPLNEMCFIPSWHFALDFQLSVIGSVLLLIFVKNEKLGITLISLMLAISVMWTCIVAYLRKFSGFYTMSMRHMNNEDPEMNFGYTAMYPRVVPYFVGILTAYAVDKLKKKDYKFSSVQSIVPTIVLIVGAIACQYYGYVLKDQTSDSYHFLYDTIFAGLYRIIFVLPFAYILCIYFTSGLGILNKLVDRKIYVPFGRLTYCAAMSEYAFLIYQLSLQRANIPTSTQLNMYMLAISHIIISYILALILYLMVDGPTGGLLNLLKQRMFQQKAKKKVK